MSFLVEELRISRYSRLEKRKFRNKNSKRRSSVQAGVRTGKLLPLGQLMEQFHLDNVTLNKKIK
jgi:hypothetical protein